MSLRRCTAEMLLLVPIAVPHGAGFTFAICCCCIYGKKRFDALLVVERRHDAGPLWRSLKELAALERACRTALRTGAQSSVDMWSLDGFNLQDSASSEDCKRLDFAVHKCSSHSANYEPQNILEDRPTDQASRWSSDSNAAPQFLVLKLARPALVHTICFGKFEKTHVCNLKRFQVLGGMSEDRGLVMLLEAGLRNDAVAETFTLRKSPTGAPFPCRYVKLVPLESWGPSFNFSIWFVELRGDETESRVRCELRLRSVRRERALARLCLKHLRAAGYRAAFEALAPCAPPLEAPLLQRLHCAVVETGDACAAEDLLAEAAHAGLLDEYMSLQEYQPHWEPVETGPPHALRPGRRGGHQMALDPVTDSLYLLGGWDGSRDLADLWQFDLAGSRGWTRLSVDTAADGGPSARSCHKVVLDAGRRQMFTLGRYLDTAARTADKLRCEVHMLDLSSMRWTLVCDDTAALGGPRLVFDHQLALDVATRTLYVFGGRELASNGTDEPVFSGLYAWAVSTNTWTRLAPDCPRIRARVGHSMLFHPSRRLLFVLSGQRQREYLNDFFSVHVDTGAVTRLGGVATAAGFTQRATIDPDADEIYVLSGLSKDKEKRDESAQNSFWVYSIKTDTWSCVYREVSSPCPRFAHQLVLDPARGQHLLFGGNPGNTACPAARLDDFWRLTLRRPALAPTLDKLRLLVRERAFHELAARDRVAALEYLQTSVGQLVDHSEPTQAKQFQLLAARLFDDDAAPLCDPDRDLRSQRTALFDRLSEFFPSEMSQPRVSLQDLYHEDLQ